jgi:hypothetical protein
MDRKQAEIEARARITWGDDRHAVTGFLVSNGYSTEEAIDTANELFTERAADVRVIGIRKIIFGAGLAAYPFVIWFIEQSTGIFHPQSMGAAILVGLIGPWKVVQGIRMACAPAADASDLSETAE